VLFVPQENGAITACYSLASRTAGGRRYVTDNLYIPFGALSRELVCRTRPWRRSLVKQVARHQERVRQDGAALLAWTSSPIEDINQQQQQMRMINTELGYLLPHADREEYGKITPEAASASGRKPGCWITWHCRPLH